MASFKSKLFNFMMRNRHWFRGKLRKDVFDMDTSIPAFREQCEKGAAKYARIPKNVEIRKIHGWGARAEWIIPKNSPQGKLVFYVHGGGYVSGSCSDHRGFVAKLADHCGITNFLYEYRLAPEYPFPYALEDSISMYEKVLGEGYLPSDIIFVGESAGGGLLLALLLALRDRGMELPCAAVAISPWTDLNCTNESYHTKNKVSVAPAAFMECIQYSLCVRGGC